jgi:hypothetical protein
MAIVARPEAIAVAKRTALPFMCAPDSIEGFTMKMYARLR